jgi:hypothetical protein
VCPIPLPEPQPCLVVELPLEGEPVLRLSANSAEDEQRLLGWLLRSRALRQLGMEAYEALDAYERSVRR